MNTLDAINEIKNIAKKNAERQKDQRTHDVSLRTVPVGKCYRQGDLYIFRVKNDHPVGEEIARDKIADGVSLGSSHVLIGKFKVYKGVKAPDCIADINARVGLGYAFDVEDGSVNVHLEHDHFCFTDGGRFQVVHQLDIRTLQRALD